MLIIISTLQFPNYSWYRLAAIISLVLNLLCVGGERELGTHCLHMLSSPRISGNLGIGKICSVTLTSVRHADFCVKDVYHWPRWWQRSDEGNKLLELSMRLFVQLKSYSTWLTQSFPLKFTNFLERSNAVTVRVILSKVSKPPEGVSQAVLLCSEAFQQVNRIFPLVSVVSRSPRELCTYVNMCTRFSFLLPRTRAWERG